MRVEEAYGSWSRSRLTREGTGRLLDVSERTCLRYVDRYDDFGLDGLTAKRLEQASHRRAPVDEVMTLNARS